MTNTKSTNVVLFSLVLLLLGFGLNILLASSAFVAEKEHADAYFYIKRQGLFALIGLLFLFLFSQVDIEIFSKYAWPLYIFSLIGLVLPLIPGIGIKAGGASRWVRGIGFSIQPSDIAKFSTMLLLARLYSRKEQFDYNSILITLAVILAPAALIFIEPDFGTSLHLLFSCGFFLFFTGFPLRIMIIILFVAVPVVYKNIVDVPYRWNRIIAFLDPLQYRYEGAHQLVTSLLSFKNGGVFGQGFGVGIQKHRIQARHNDFILSVIAEDLGMLGLAVILLLVFAICFYGGHLLMQVKDTFSRLLGTGILILFFVQASLNICVAMGLLPTTGINLPLVSYGGTSVVVYLSMFGVLLAITRKS